MAEWIGRRLSYSRKWCSSSCRKWCSSSCRK